MTSIYENWVNSKYNKKQKKRIERSMLVLGWNPRMSKAETLEYNRDKVAIILAERTKSAKRLEAEGKWIDRINIFYSCFTAILAIIGVTKYNTDFLPIISACYTVILTILVVYASTLRCIARAHDLRANCIDLEKILKDIDSEMETAITINNDTRTVTDNDAYDKASKLIDKALELQKDSEYPSAEDREKCELGAGKALLYGVFVLFAIATIVYLVYSIQQGVPTT